MAGVLPSLPSWKALCIGAGLFLSGLGTAVGIYSYGVHAGKDSCQNEQSGADALELKTAIDKIKGNEATYDQILAAIADDKNDAVCPVPDVIRRTIDSLPSPAAH